MKPSTLKLCVLLLFIAAVCFSCKLKGPKELIEGTWEMVDVKSKITFYDNGIVVLNNYGNPVADTLTYTVSDDGQYFYLKGKTDNSNGRQKIMELTDTTLKFKAEINNMDIPPFFYKRKYTK